jgi:hypothetical protein
VLFFILLCSKLSWHKTNTPKISVKNIILCQGCSLLQFTTYTVINGTIVYLLFSNYISILVESDMKRQYFCYFFYNLPLLLQNFLLWSQICSNSYRFQHILFHLEFVDQRGLLNASMSFPSNRFL